MPDSSNKYDFQRMEITNVPSRTKKQLVNIAKYEGTTLSALIKPKLKEILREYPDDIKEGLD